LKRALIFFIIILIGLSVYAEEINEDNIENILEYAYQNNRISILMELLDFLQPKWNFDPKYAAQVLGFMTGIMGNNREIVEYYNSKKYSMVNDRMTKIFDYIENGNAKDLWAYMIDNKVSVEKYVWYIYFGNGNTKILDGLIDVYNINDVEDLNNILLLRYYYERHDEIKQRVDKRKEIPYQTVSSMTYEEMKKRILEKYIEDMKKSWKK
jgi:hypothetical protein